MARLSLLGLLNKYKYNGKTCHGKLNENSEQQIKLNYNMT